MRDRAERRQPNCAVRAALSCAAIILCLTAAPVAAQQGSDDDADPVDEIGNADASAVPGVRPSDDGRAAENAVASAADAFGTRIGREAIGLYGPGSVRGFSPTAAGNVRIEGLYFDQQAGLTARIQSGSRILVGIASQADPFPAPTGIVDISLRGSSTPGVSALLLGGPYRSYGGEIDARFTALDSRLTATVGFGAYRDSFANGGSGSAIAAGAVGRFRLTNRLAVTGFFGQSNVYDETAPPVYIPRDPVVPPRIERGGYDGPSWALRNSQSNNFGVIANFTPGAWQVDLGVFRSFAAPRSSFANLIDDIDASGTGERLVFANPPSRFASTSGELRIARSFSEGPRHHRLLVSLRARSVESRFGGSDLVELGRAPIGETIAPTRPVFSFGEQTLDRVRQITGGIAYGLKWSDLFDLRVGLQLARYRKSVVGPFAADRPLNSNELLPNVTASVSLTPQLLIYGSYAVGLEENGQAPDFAVNRLTLLPALITNQVDFGARWQPSDRLSVILGYFRIEKPYFNLDPSRFFGRLGDETHEGIEFSVRARPSDALTVVAGAVVQDPRVSAASALDTVSIRPVGQPKLTGQINIDYMLPWLEGLSIDASVSFNGSRKGDVANLVDLPSYVLASLGARYRFRLVQRATTFRVSVSNVTNEYAWIPIGSGAFEPLNQRSIQAYLAIDF